MSRLGGTPIFGPVSEHFKWSVEAATLAADVLELKDPTRYMYIQELCRVWQEAEKEAKRARDGEALFNQIKNGRNDENGCRNFTDY